MYTPPSIRSAFPKRAQEDRPPKSFFKAGPTDEHEGIRSRENGAAQAKPNLHMLNEFYQQHASSS